MRKVRRERDCIRGREDRLRRGEGSLCCRVCLLLGETSSTVRIWLESKDEAEIYLGDANAATISRLYNSFAAAHLMSRREVWEDDKSI